MFNDLKIFIDQNGHAKPNRFLHKKLYTWVSGQRENNKKNKLSQERINKLNSLKEWLWEG